MIDQVSGLGISISDIDKYSIYNLAKYCDETISDGLGGTIPRYTLDYQFQERSGVTQFLSQILSICNANIITNEFGQISVIYIYPNQVIKRNVTNANVIDGSFTYQSSGLESRTTLANVTYNNGLNFGRTDTATVSDDTLITRYGLQVIDVVLPGCYHEAQAIRKARYTLFVNCYMVNFVSFAVFLDGLTYKIGDLIRIFDNYNQNETQGGLIQSSVSSGGNTVLTFDRSCALDAGTYTFYIYDVDGNQITKSVSGGTTLSTITINSTVNVAINSPFVFSGPASGKIYRITDIQKNDQSIYAVTALEWSESIFDYINGSITIVPKSGDYANLNDLSTSPVINLNIAQNFGSNGTYRTSNLIVSWLWDVANAQKYQAKFKLAYSKDGGQQHIVENINTDTYAIPNPFPGVYEITVWAVNPVTGFLSTPVNTTYNFRTSVAASTLQPPVNLVVAGTAGTTFSTRDVTIAWESNPDNALATVEDVLHDYVVELYDQTATLYGTYSVPRQNAVSTVDPYDSTTTYWQLPGSFTLPFADNYAYFGTAKRQLTFAVYARDTMGDLSDPAWVTVNNPAPTFTSLTVDTGISAVNVTIGVSSEPDVKDYLVYRGSSSGFTPSAGNLVYRGSNSQIIIKTPDNNNYYYKAAISDSFGEDSLNYSSAVAQSSYTVTNGTNGVNGAMTYKIYYKATNQGTPPSTPSNTTNGATPAEWSSSPVTLTGVEAQFESDGSQAAGSTTTVWSTPYLSYFKVNKLEAITAQMGALTVDDKLTVSTGGKIASGQTAYDTGTGYWLEYNAGIPRFSLGNSSNGIAWDGSALNVRGNVIATNNINQNAISKVYAASGSTVTITSTGAIPDPLVELTGIVVPSSSTAVMIIFNATYYNNQSGSTGKSNYKLYRDNSPITDITGYGSTYFDLEAISQSTGNGNILTITKVFIDNAVTAGTHSYQMKPQTASTWSVNASGNLSLRDITLYAIPLQR